MEIGREGDYMHIATLCTEIGREGDYIHIATLSLPQ